MASVDQLSPCVISTPSASNVSARASAEPRLFLLACRGSSGKLAGMTAGKSVRLFLVDGTPGGLITAEIMNWTGHIIAAPRSDLAALLRRDETTRTGVYILLGDDPESVGGLLAYIGEGDDVSKRLYQHSRPEVKAARTSGIAPWC